MLNRVQFFETKNWSVGVGGSSMTALLQSISFISSFRQAHSLCWERPNSIMSRCFSVGTVASFDFGQEDE